METSEPMRLLGLDDRVSALDLGSIALDQLGTIVRDIPPEKWGEAAKKLPTDFVKSICKQGAVDQAGSALEEYGLSVGVGAVAGVCAGLITDNVMIGVASGAIAAVATYFISHAENS